jgi:hypothetical protein
MAKRTCDPTSGSIGKQTYGIGRNGQFVRYRAIPANPKTITQEAQRALLTTVSKDWDRLSDDQRKAWSVAATGYNSKTRLGSHGPLTGNQYFCRINATLGLISLDQVDDPPAYIAPDADPTSSLTITNTAGTIAIKLGMPDDPGISLQVWSSKPCKPGVQRTPELFFLGLCAAPAQGSATITSLVTAKWGVLPVGVKLFIGTRQQAGGFVGPMSIWQDTVPAA